MADTDQDRAAVQPVTQARDTHVRPPGSMSVSRVTSSRSCVHLRVATPGVFLLRFARRRLVAGRFTRGVVAAHRSQPSTGVEGVGSHREVPGETHIGGHGATAHRMQPWPTARHEPKRESHRSASCSTTSARFLEATDAARRSNSPRPRSRPRSRRPPKAPACSVAPPSPDNGDHFLVIALWWGLSDAWTQLGRADRRCRLARPRADPVLVGRGATPPINPQARTHPRAR